MPDSTAVSSFLATVADTKNQPVFVHCGSANRVGGMWMIKRVLQDKWPIEQRARRGRGHRPARAGDDRVRHRVHQLATSRDGPGRVPAPRPRARGLDGHVPRAGRAVSRRAARRAWRRPPALPADAPEQGEPFDAVFADFERVLVPALTHWNHPGFMAYFASSASPPGVLGEMLAAALNQQAMLWKTSPASTELEEVDARLAAQPDRPAAGVRRRHLRHRVDLDAARARGRARARRARTCAMHGLAGAGAPLRVYASEHAHSSIDKAVHDARLRPRRAAQDSGRRGVTGCAPTALDAAIADDLARGVQPVAVVATIGTTSTTSVDPVAAIADDLRAARRLAARGRGVRRRGGDRARAAAALRRVGARRFDRRQPAQVAVHADGRQRALLPPHARCCAPRSRWCPTS